ncbi:SPFH domain-containing protein [Bacteroidales bacterium AH-315-I05]|nr:SPFH domain-containing protein [Bacteroidales bacterium AH-315-I05]
MKTEKIIKTMSGYTMIGIHFIVLIAAIFSIAALKNPFIFIPLVLIFIFIMPGYFIVNPNSSKVLILFGKYIGTVKQDGFHWANPFYLKKVISLRARNLDGDKIKVNDSLGNPIIIGAVIVWRVEETAHAAFEVDDYEQYVKIQSDAAVRKLAGAYPYDSFEDDEMDVEMTLRSGGDKINEMLEEQLQERLDRAGVIILEARITHLAYAEEIAGAMLQRQQATAVVAARMKIVEGAVGMVEIALDRLSKEQIVDLDEERKAAMVSNLMVVLCSDKAATPVVNTGTLYN